MNGTPPASTFSPLDRHFADLLGRLATESTPDLALAAKLASRWRAKGHICLALPDVAGEVLEETKPERAPALASWRKSLRRSGVVGRPGEFFPLILDDRDRLYLHRYWKYERTLAEAIRDRLAAAPPPIDEAILEKGLARLFGADRSAVDWQREAARTAVRERFCTISGGPGTGKTRTVANILALLVEQGATRIALTAPTGKAAARLKESMSKATIDCAAEVRAAFPTDVTTIHRLLGARPDTSALFRNRENPLDAEVVVVDEASMVDVPLMAKLFDAVRPDARIVLLGDRNQLASVEAGYALGDICGPDEVAERDAPPIARTVVELRRNYRFTEESGIARLAVAVRNGDADTALALLRDRKLTDISWKTLPSAASIGAELRKRVLANWIPDDELFADESLRRLGNQQILCAVHEGPWGRANLNSTVERLLADAGRIQPGERWYRGRPIMILRNDANLKLFNGDIGVVLPDSQSGAALRAFFSADGEVRGFLPARLPEHETAFAMTVHKSQGSEFGDVLMVLPGADSPVLTRELIYTGLTRAREKVEVWANESVFRAALGRKVERSSGLRDALWR